MVALISPRRRSRELPRSLLCRSARAPLLLLHERQGSEESHFLITLRHSLLPCCYQEMTTQPRPISIHLRSHPNMKDSRVGMMQNSMDAFALNVVRKRTICDL